jgi:hypothetical protein
MNQEQLLARRDELARENQLGELEMYRTPMTFRGRLILGAVFGGLALLAFIGMGAYAHYDIPPLLLIYSAIPFSLIPVGYPLTDRNYVYVYTNGLVCFNSSGGEQIIHWGRFVRWGGVVPAMLLSMSS